MEERADREYTSSTSTMMPRSTAGVRAHTHAAPSAAEPPCQPVAPLPAPGGLHGRQAGGSGQKR